MLGLQPTVYTWVQHSLLNYSILQLDNLSYRLQDVKNRIQLALNRSLNHGQSMKTLTATAALACMNSCAASASIHSLRASEWKEIAVMISQYLMSAPHFKWQRGIWLSRKLREESLGGWKLSSYSMHWSSNHYMKNSMTGTLKVLKGFYVQRLLFAYIRLNVRVLL